MTSLHAQRAVSEYEHLNLVKSKKNYEDIDDDEVYTIPLKPINPTSLDSISCKTQHSMSTVRDNENNSNSAQSLFKLQEKLNALRANDDLHLQPANYIPVPVNWSPIKSNPSLWLTPEKGANGKDQAKYVPITNHVLECQDINRIPQPSRWSPGMMVRPDPNLFVTPEKADNIKAPVIKVKYARHRSDAEENIEYRSDLQETGVKEKHSVRFDLPSVSSGDETCVSLNGSVTNQGSPITLRGLDIIDESVTPVWKSFSPCKSYNPNAYSDESALDDSILNLHSQNKTTVNLSTVPETFTKSLTQTNNTSGINATISVPKSAMFSQITSVYKVESKAGPQFIKSAYSQFDTDHPKPSVVREGKNKFVSAEYSFPFEAGAVGGDYEYEHVFARPEYNSTLKVRSELDALCQQEIDIERALQETLSKSELRRTEINEKAASYTNRQSNQFNNLVNLDTSVESLCERIVRLRTGHATGKQKTAPLDQKSAKSDKSPDLMEFFSPDLQRESPNFSLPGVGPQSVRLMSAPLDVAFDLYRHNRVWYGLRDF